MTFPKKDTLKKLITENKQDEVIKILSDYTKAIKDSVLNSEVILVETNFNHLGQAQRIGINSYDQQILERSKINKSLLELVNLLPEDLNAVVEGKSEAPSKGISEQRITQLLTQGMSISKIIPILLFLFMFLDKEPFPIEQLLTICAFFLPIFFLFIPKFVQHNFHKENIIQKINYQSKRWFTSSFRNFIWKFFVVYLVFVLLVISIYPYVYSFEIMLILLGLIECVFGIYLGKIVEHLKY